MSKEKVNLGDTVASGLAAFRGDPQDPEERFIVLGYTDNNTINVVASGAGGYAEVQQHLIPDDTRYCLLRKSHKVELATTIKFVYIDWTPDTVKPMRKALLSTHKGQVQDALKPYHVSFQISEPSEVDENAILNKISDSSGTSVHVTNKAEQKYTQKLFSGKSGPALVPSSVKDDIALTFEDEQAVREAIQTVRNDSSPINWCLVGYKDIKTLTLKGTGEGGVEEMASKLEDGQVFYGLFRTTETVDKVVAVKFGFVKLLSEQLKPMDKAKIGTHSGFIHTLFQPFHIEFAFDSRHEFTLDFVTKKIRDNMFLDSRVRANDTKPVQAAETKSAAKGPLVPVQGTSEVLKFEDEEAFKQALAAIRDEQNANTWTVVRYAGKHTLAVLASGEGTVEDMMGRFEDDNVNFGLLRVIDQIDNSQTVKFVYVKWQPEAVPYMKKAEVNVKKGAIDDLFRPYHVDFMIDDRKELTQAIVMDRVSSVSGSKSHVLDTTNANA